jgi:PTS system mannose-specific IIA component
MVGLLVVCHCNLAQELIETAELIVGKIKQCLGLSMDTRHSVEELRIMMGARLKELDDGDGVLILTDMFGGTPSNISLSFLDKNNVEIISGVNLPMLIKLVNLRDNKSLVELAPIIKEYGQRNIVLASRVMDTDKK